VELSRGSRWRRAVGDEIPKGTESRQNNMSSKKMVITIAVTTAALTLGTIGIASASNSKNSFKIKSAHVTRTIANPMMGGFGRFDEDGQKSQLATVLATLVTKGTLTQAQVDAINAALTAAHTSNETQGDARRAAHETLIATTIGVSVATLESRLAAGESLATIAGAKTGALVTALVAEATTEIDAAVTAGEITAAQATAFKATLAIQITAMVNATGGFGRGMGHMGGERGHDHGPGMGFPGGPTVSPNPQG
jgi:polyhydroxyalkanoate synthesis regulator phasin